MDESREVPMLTESSCSIDKIAESQIFILIGDP